MPKLVTVLREGYGLARLRKDAVAGLTVAIVALPLSMAIAIASGASPAQGLYTAIVGGFLVSALGGSRYQIGGPAGAFIVLVGATVGQHGMDGLILATFLSGLILSAVGFLRLGTFVKFIPFPVTVGFTAGIATIILASQLREILGLRLTVPEPGPLLEKLPVLWQALPTASGMAVALSAGTAASIVALRIVRPHWPGMLIAVAVAACVAAGGGVEVTTIGSQFGGIPGGLPAPRLPDLSPARIMEVMPAAMGFALLGAIESLLSAVVADGMSGGRHRSNCELVAQGVANVGSALFGGFCVTGTIARTATNVRAGAQGPVAGMLHAAFLLLFMLVAAPLAAYVPLAALAGVLAVVAWNMVERPAIAALLRSGWGDAAVLATTFLLTVLRDLTEAIVVGFALAGLVFINRMSAGTTIAESRLALPEMDLDGDGDTDVVVYHLNGPWFFGAAARLGSVLDQVSERPRALVVDFAAVPLIDSSGAYSFALLARKMARREGRLVISGASAEVRRVLHQAGVQGDLVLFVPSLDAVPEAMAAQSRG